MTPSVRKVIIQRKLKITGRNASVALWLLGMLISVTITPSSGGVSENMMQSQMSAELARKWLTCLD